MAPKYVWEPVVRSELEVLRDLAEILETYLAKRHADRHNFTFARTFEVKKMEKAIRLLLLEHKDVAA